MKAIKWQLMAILHSVNERSQRGRKLPGGIALSNRTSAIGYEKHIGCHPIYGNTNAGQGVVRENVASSKKFVIADFQLTDCLSQSLQSAAIVRREPKHLLPELHYRRDQITLND